ncbi:hypothetical protein B9479_005032 [Cryptococcus floricola]|uniref:Phosphatidate cytidylyltransferase n=1 Tax=Cryptococcus floricola TaxID=2591691 RepID=A0A5D3AVR9_9TREE|nr:hypothetical protein B9479_005032 [Cryptococcus floricola]
MSRSQPLFSGGMFQVLGSGADHHEEEEEEEPELIETSPKDSQQTTTSTTLSKSARKRLARLAAKTPGRTPSNSHKGGDDSVTTSDESDPSPLNEKAGFLEAPQPVAKLTRDASAVEPVQSRSIEAPYKGSAADTLGEASTKLEGNRKATSSSERSTKGEEKESGLAASPVAPASVPMASSPPSSEFSPSLPESLPQPTGQALPANRKRKTPQDFTPAGPGNLMSPASSNKIAVKFEDGLSPGEGKEGEKTIAPKKDRNAMERTVWTFIMVGGFITLLCLGHPYMILLVMLCQALVYKEITALFDLRDHGGDVTTSEKDESWSKTLNWYFFVVTNYFLYGESIIYYFKHIVFVDAYFIPFARNHRFISFMLYVVGFVGFVGNLQKQHLRQQFALFCWVHMTLLLIVVSSHFIVNNILEGLIWFFVPASLVICNDIMAYVCGKMFGKTPLIKLSPKKTVEGFVGAFICTLLFGFFWGTFWMKFPYMICPARDLGTNVFSQLSCRPNPVFVWRQFEFTGAAGKVLETILGHPAPSFPYAPFQIHALVMATFASLVAPFGGFFASGFKRAFNIKDFGHSIPGHGGMTDRMDCQFMMGLFSYVYYSSLIRIQYVTPGSIMQTVVTSLSPNEQVELLADLGKFLKGQGLL